MIVEVYTDASVKENAFTISYQIYSDRYSAICRKYYDKKCDNNIAEMIAIYQALKHLSFLYRCRGFTVNLYCDSKNAVTLFNNNFTSDQYQQIKNDIEKLIIQFKSCLFIHVKAHTKNKDVHSLRNFLADKLCKESLIQKNSKFYLLYNDNYKTA